MFSACVEMRETAHTAPFPNYSKMISANNARARYVRVRELRIYHEINISKKVLRVSLPFSTPGEAFIRAFRLRNSFRMRKTQPSQIEYSIIGLISTAIAVSRKRNFNLDNNSRSDTSTLLFFDNYSSYLILIICLC